MSKHSLENCKDVFLSHASRDKEPYVRQFAQELDRLRISYWLDQAEIKWGDKITKRINEGLRSSRYVIVFLSENFLGRNWPEAELEAALSKENADGETVVLPIIIGDTSKILNRYPLLRDKLYLEWDDDLSTISSHLANLLTPGGASNLLTPSRHETSNKRGAKIRPLGLRRYFAKKIVKVALISGGLLLIVLIGTFYLFNYPSEAIQNGRIAPTNNLSSVAPADNFRGREFITTTDANLRAGPDTSYTQVGVAVRGSRVLVLEVRGRWCKVTVIEYGRPKIDSESADEGWVNSTYLRQP